MIKINLAWSRFLVGAAALVVVTSIAVLPDAALHGWNSGNTSTFMIVASILLFLGYRWHRLRIINAESPITVGSPIEILRPLFGPVLPAIIWFLVTFSAAVAFSVIPLLRP